MVSVIVPAYNAELYIKETLRSVLASDFRDLEVVVVNDGSTDQTLAEAQRVAHDDERVRVFTQKNAGPAVARNTAIAHSRGQYILPLDADDLISPTFIGEAAAILDADPQVKAVAPRSVFFGDRSGEWRLPDFSLARLARRNVMHCTAMYRRADYDRTGGYCPEIIAREDWEFWIALLKDGGKVVRTTEHVDFFYRVHAGSKRFADRGLKRHVVDTLNRRHPEFFRRWLGGPLRYQRSLSRLINLFTR